MSQLSSFTATTQSLRFSSLTRRARVGWLGTALLGVALCWTGSAQAAPMVVTSLADFNTAIGSAPTTTDPFNNDIPGAVTINLDSLVVSTLAGGQSWFC